ncbi:hypothetical protein [Shewanella sp.]|uniref:hypothetical protein n=1 Tax=Shewanella sp. TaxID=50422 RepID=UPI003A97C5FF
MPNSDFKVILYLFWMALLVSALQLARFLLQDPSELTTLTHAQLQQDLQQLEQELLSYSAFGTLNPELKQQLATQRAVVEQRYPKQLSRFQLSAEVAKMVALLDDPGSSVGNWRTAARLPATLQPMDQHWLALNDAERPLDAKLPFITHIDGVPMSRWESAAKAFLPSNASPQQLAQLLSHTYLLRQQIGLPDAANVRLTLSDLQHDQRSILKPLSPARLAQQLPMSRWRLLSPEVQLLQTNDLDLFENNRQLRLDLQKAQRAATLVIDLRHANGLSNALTLQLAKSHVRPSSQPSGFGRYKRHPKLRSDTLAAYGYQPLSQFTLFPALKVVLLQAEQPKLSEFFARPPLLTPKQTPEESQQQLLLLIGPDCRLECEWLAHAAANWPNTLLLGTDTSGDYGRRYTFRLPASNLNVTISASLAYDHYGNLLSGKGTQVDIDVADSKNVNWPMLLEALRQYQQQSVAP